MERVDYEKLLGELRDRVGEVSSALQMLDDLLSKGSPREKAHVTVINRSLYQLHRTITHLELNREEDPVFQPRTLDLAGLCRDLGQRLEGLVKMAGVELRWEAEPANLFCLADKELLELALLNLVSNAVEAAGPGGRVELTLCRDKDRAKFTVSDNGPGLKLPQEAKPTLKTAGGLGLGLPTARRIAKLHGGSVLLKNAAQGGVRAVLSIPVRKADPRVGERRSPGFGLLGGATPELVELSALLPSELYLTEDL